LVEQGKVREAIREFELAARKQPNSVAAHWSLAQAYLDIGDGAAAEPEIRRSAALGLHRQSAAWAHADALLLQAKFAEALDALGLAQVDAASDRETAHFLRGLARLGLNDVGAARSEFEAAQRLVPGSALAHVGFARAALAEDNMSLAERHLGEALKSGSGSRRVLELQGDIAYAGESYAQSEAAYLKVVEMRPQGLHGHLGIARAQLMAGKTADALKRLDLILDGNPGHVGAAYLRAVAAIQAKDYVAARTYGDLVLAALPHAPSALIAGVASFARGQFQPAAQHLERFVARVPASEPARRLLAAAHSRLGQRERAAEALQTVGQKEVGESALVAELSAAIVKSGDFESAPLNLQRLAEVASNDTARSAGGSLSKVALEVANDGAREIEASGGAGATADQQQLLRVLNLLRAGENAKALQEAEALQKARPADPNGFVLGGLAEAAQGDARKAAASLERALELQPGDPQASRVLAILEMRAGDIDSARKRLETALTHNPGHAATSELLAEVEARAGRPDVAIAHLESAIAKSPEDIRLRVPAARLHFARGQFAKSLAVIEPLLARFPTDPTVLELAGRTELALGRHREAVATLRALVDAQPSDREAIRSPDAHLLLATAYAGVPDAEAARKELEAVLAVSPEHREAKIMLAKLAVGAGWLDLAEQLVGDLGAADRDDAAVAEIEGLLRLAQKRPAEALRLLRRAFEKGPTAGRAVQVARAQWSAGDRESAEATLQAWLDDHPDDRAVRFAYANYLGALERLAAARFEYQMLVDQAPDDPVALNELAYLLVRLGEPDAALPHARRARDLAPQNPEVIDTLASALLAKGDTGEAVELLYRALTIAPDNRTVRYHLAKALVTQGARAAAKEELARILGDARPFDGRTDAERLLRELGG
jgi:putative PEP-CTERM system TPR-repeat lipoprotein